MLSKQVEPGEHLGTMALELVGGFMPSETSPHVSVGVFGWCFGGEVTLSVHHNQNFGGVLLNLHPQKVCIYISTHLISSICLSTYLITYLLYLLTSRMFLFYPSISCNHFFHVMTNRILTFDSTVSS